jgi:hypothetical protein
MRFCDILALSQEFVDIDCPIPMELPKEYSPLSR